VRDEFFVVELDRQIENRDTPAAMLQTQRRLQWDTGGDIGLKQGGAQGDIEGGPRCTLTQGGAHGIPVGSHVVHLNKGGCSGI